VKLGEIIKNSDRIYVNGAWTASASDRRLAVLNAATGDLCGTVPDAAEEDVNRAVAAARQAFDSGPWPRMSHHERAGYMLRLADELDQMVELMSVGWTIESGILHRDTTSMSKGIGGTFRYYAGLADTFAFEERHEPAAGNGIGLLIREPVGVVAAVIPWNAVPFILAGKVAPALLAGCTVVVKAPPSAPSGAYLFAEACERVGLPAGVVNVIAAERDASEALVSHPGVDKVSFTGSTEAGRRILSICGERIARCTMELGGKSPAIVLDDYSVESAAETLASQATFMTGQICSGITRVIVSANRHDDMVEALSARFRATKVGDPFDQGSDMGALAMARQRDRVEDYIRKGVADGARIAAGGSRPAHLNTGYFFEPTVLAGVSNDWTVAREEIFGPVLCVIPAASEQVAIDIANDTIYGLNSLVFTNDNDAAYAVARRIRAGTVGHNTFRSDFKIGFGGFKQSGVGREGGVEGLLPYLESKTVILNGERSASA
jgi:aldehyde dehydrogenase (NAD+)